MRPQSCGLLRVSPGYLRLREREIEVLYLATCCLWPTTCSLTKTLANFAASQVMLYFQELLLVNDLMIGTCRLSKKNHTRSIVYAIHGMFGNSISNSMQRQSVHIGPTLLPPPLSPTTSASRVQRMHGMHIFCPGLAAWEGLPGVQIDEVQWTGTLKWPVNNFPEDEDHTAYADRSDRLNDFQTAPLEVPKWMDTVSEKFRDDSLLFSLMWSPWCQSVDVRGQNTENNWRVLEKSFGVWTAVLWKLQK